MWIDKKKFVEYSVLKLTSKRTVLFSQRHLLEVGDNKKDFENVGSTSCIGKIEEVKTLDLIVYLRSFDLEN